MAIQTLSDMHGKKRKTVIASEFDNIPEVHEFVSQVTSEFSLSRETAFAVRLAVEEACTNIVRYAFPEGKKSDIELTFEVSRHKLLVTVVDDGIPFDPTKAEPPDITSPVERRRPGGLGIYLIKEFMDEVSYEKKKGKNILRMVKYL